MATPRTNLVPNSTFGPGAGATGWGVDYPAVVGVAGSADWTAFGTGSLKVTTKLTTAADQWSTYPNPAMPVVGGADYTGSAYVRTATATARNMTIGIAWFGASGFISSGRATVVSVTNAAPAKRLVFTATAPAAATTATAFVMCPDAGVPAGESFYIDGMLFEQSTTVRGYFDGSLPGARFTGTAYLSPSELAPRAAADPPPGTAVTRWNMVDNPSAEVTIAPGFSRGFPAEVALTRSTEWAMAGTANAKVQVTTPCAANHWDINVNPWMAGFIGGQVYTISVYVRLVATRAYQFGFFVYYRRPDDGALAGSFASTPQTIQPGVTTRLVHTFTMPEDAYYLMPVAVCREAVPVAGETLFTDGWMVEPADQAGSYFDGSMAPATWVGTAHASVSQLAYTVPALPALPPPVTPTYRVNFLPNSSGELTPLSGWVSDFPAVTTVARVTEWLPFGAACLKATVAVTTGHDQWQVRRSPYVAAYPSTTYSVSVYARMATATARDLTLGVGFYGPDGLWMGEAVAAAVNVTNAAPAKRLTLTFTTPPGTYGAAPWVRCATAGVAAGEAFWLDGFLLEADTQPGSYFDGSFPGARFTGAAHNSASELLSLEPAPPPGTAITRWNMVANPSGEVNYTPGFSKTYPNTTVSRSTQWAGYGGASIKAQVATTAGPEQWDLTISPWLVNCIGGQRYTASVYVRSLSSRAYQFVLQAFHRKPDGNPTAGTFTFRSPAYTIELSQTIRMVHTFTMPDEACDLVFMVTCLDGGVPAGEAVCTDGWMLEPAGQVGTYFDGSIPPATWQGTAHLSPSTLVYVMPTPPVEPPLPPPVIVLEPPVRPEAVHVMGVGPWAANITWSAANYGYKPSSSLPPWPIVALPDPSSASVTLRRSAPGEARVDLLLPRRAALPMQEMITDLWWRRRDPVTDITESIGRFNCDTADLSAEGGRVTLSASLVDYRGIIEDRLYFSNKTYAAGTAGATVLRDVTPTNASVDVSILDTVNIGTLSQPYNLELGTRVGDVYGAVQALCPAFDWAVEMEDTAGGLARLRIWPGGRGTDRGVVLIDSGDGASPIAAWSRRGSSVDFANAVYFSGKYGGAFYVLPGAGSVPQGQRDLAESDTSLTTQLAVEAAAVKLVTVRSELAASWTLTLAPGVWQGRSHIDLGDPVRIGIRLGEETIAAVHPVEEIEVALDGGAETVTVTVGVPRVAADQRSRRAALARLVKRMKNGGRI